MKNRTTLGAASLYAVLWGMASTYLALVGASWIDGAAILAIVAVIFIPAAVLLTRGRTALPQPILFPRRESLALIAYAAFYGLAIYGPIYGWLKDALPDGPVQEAVTTLFALFVHVVLPSLVVIAVGGQIRSLWRADTRSGRVWLATGALSALMLAMNAVLSPSLGNLAAVVPDAASRICWVALAWVWVAIAAGLCEEYLFRGLLLTRWEAWSGSGAAAIVASALVFALAHVPGLYLRAEPGTFGQSTDIFKVIAFAIATLSPLGLFFGVLWRRTHNLLIVAVVHGAVDALPFSAEAVKLVRTLGMVL